jgi:single-strand DNA-binding protein
MAGETQITIVGNLTGDPELRFIASGAAVVNFTVASTPRQFDKQANEFKDGETLFMRCSLWRDTAEHVAESLTKGMRVVVVGHLIQRSWETNGEKRSEKELQVDEIGPSLRYATAKVTRVERGGGGGGYTPPAATQPAAAQSGAGAYSDPWAADAASDEPPF